MHSRRKPVHVTGFGLAENGQFWEKYLRPIENITGEELFSESVMTTYFSEHFNWLWVGTGDGMAISDNDGIIWKIYRFWESSIYNHKEMIDILSKFENIGPSHMSAPNDDGGLGFGGHCFPKDVEAFLNYSKSEILQQVIDTNSKLKD